METFYQNEILEFDKNSIDFLKMQKVKLYFDKVDIGNQTGIVKEIISSILKRIKVPNSQSDSVKLSSFKP